MDPIERATLDALDFEHAAAVEAKAWRNLLPPEPWLDIVGRFPNKFAEYTKLRLEAGIPNASSVISRARKPHQQTRPVPVVGIPERIAYRAICDQILASRTPADRSQEAYRRFIAGPIQSAFGSKPMRLKDVTKHYVVESDIAAFYEYIDHSRLLQELQLRTSMVQLPRLIVRLLTEIQGRPVGLPQLLDPSDELSEVYASIVERELLRQGISVWRYNDDFRIAASSYDEAQAYLEAFARESSSVGLVLNERKTRIVKFDTYFWKNWAGSQDEGDVEFKPELIRMSGDYGELDEDELAAIAQEIFARLRSSPDTADHINPANLSADDNRDLSRAIGILTNQGDSFGLGDVVELFEYAPHLGHRLGAYLVALHKAGVDIGPTWDLLVARSKVFNAWQRVWLVHIARVGQLLTKPVRRTWVQSQGLDVDPLLRAEAALALAPHKLASFDEIDRAVRQEPEALIPWYALAAKLIPGVNPRRLQALKDSHGLIEILLHKSPGGQRKK